MASKIKVDQIEGSAGSSITIPSGQTLTITDGLAASTIGSGTLADARIPNLNASKITAGTIATARLGSGTASSSTFLRGDGTFAAAGSGNVSQVMTTTSQTFNNGSAYTTFNGLSLAVTPSSTSTKLLILLNTYANCNGAQGWGLRIKAGGNSITNGTQLQPHAMYQDSGGQHLQNHFNVVYAPNTTSSVTFTVEAKNNNDSNVTLNSGCHSIMTIVEIG